MKKEVADGLRENILIELRAVGSIPADQAAEMMNIAYSMGQLKMLKKVEIYDDTPVPKDALRILLDDSEEADLTVEGHKARSNLLTWLENDEKKT